MKFYRFILGAAFFACIALVGFGIGTAVAGGPPALMTAADSKAHAANNEGIEHYNQEHFDVALGHFQKAVEADPGSAEAHYNLALALDATDKHMEAANHFKMAQDLGKNNPDIQNSKILKAHVERMK